MTVDRTRLREAAEVALPDAARVIHAIRSAVEFYAAYWFVEPDGGDGALKQDGPAGRMLAFLTAANPEAALALLDLLDLREQQLREATNLDDRDAELIMLRRQLTAAQRELELLREATTRVVDVSDPDDCGHNRRVDPETGTCLDCGTVLP